MKGGQGPRRPSGGGQRGGPGGGGPGRGKSGERHGPGGPRRGPGRAGAGRPASRRAPEGPVRRSEHPQRPERPAPPPGFRLADIDELELTIEKLVAGGDGLARHDGVPIFVPRTAPGDRVRARLTERRPDYARAEVVELIAGGPGRRVPPCPHFAECGGCDLQHLDESTQLRLKVLAAGETLSRMARIELPAPEVVAGANWRYRIRTQLHTRRGDSGLEVGYHARGSRRLVPIRECRVLDPRLEEAALGLAGRLGLDAPERIDLAVGADGSVAAAPPRPELDGGELRRTVAGFELAYDARCFFQGHAGLLDAMVERAVGTAEGELAYDLYGGVGLFALPLARRYRRVVTVEGDSIALRYARRNARLAAPGSVEAIGRAVESWVAEGLPPDADRVLVDPPRDGLALPVRLALAERPPRRLTYVSCHAAALARDLTALSARFVVESIVFLDLFPQTGHLETIVQLVRRADGAAHGGGVLPVAHVGGDPC